MRIAFSGSHRVGKSTLLELVAEALPSHDAFDEPYHLLEEDGYEFRENPSFEDFEAQLERSLETIEEAGPDALLDRSPADILAYLLTHEDAASFDTDDWLDRTRRAMKKLDLVVFVPIEEPDRISLSAHEDARLRFDVHEKLEELVVDRALDFDTDVLVVRGDARTRSNQVLTRVEQLGARSRRQKPRRGK